MDGWMDEMNDRWIVGLEDLGRTDLPRKEHSFGV